MVHWKRTLLILHTFSCFAFSVRPTSSRWFASSVSMSSSRLTLQNFLRNQVPLAAESKWKLRVYSGNEASDADSIISSLVSAYCESFDVESAASCRHLPIVSIGRQDLRLKQDVELLLRKVSLSLADLICAEEVPWESLSPNIEEIEVVLLDHNSLTKRLEAQLKSTRVPFKVVEIIDHHLDSGSHLDTVLRHTIAFDSSKGKATAGSTCSLLVSRFKSLIDWRSNSDVSLLLLGVILLDTYAENPKFAKNTPIDDQALDVLSHCLDKSDHHKLFEELADAKFDPSFWASLSASDCLRYDYKRFVSTNGDGKSFSFGTSSVLLPLSQILSKGDLSVAVMAYLHHEDVDERVDACAILSLVTDPVTKRPQRELLLVSADTMMLTKFRAFAMGNANGDILPQTNLLLEEVPVNTEGNSSSLHVALFRQGNAAASRKQVAPALQHFACDFLAETSP